RRCRAEAQPKIAALCQFSMRSDALANKVRVRAISGFAPRENPPGDFPRLRVTLGFGPLALTFRVLPAAPYLVPLTLRQLAVTLAPRFFHGTLPTPESTGNRRLTVKDVPRIGLAIAIRLQPA